MPQRLCRLSEIASNTTLAIVGNVVDELTRNLCAMYASYRNALSYMDEQTKETLMLRYIDLFENMFCPIAFKRMLSSLEKTYPDKEPTLAQLKKVYQDSFAHTHSDILLKLKEIDDRIDFLNGQLMIEPNEFAPPEPNREQVIGEKILHLKQKRSSMLESYTKEK